MLLPVLALGSQSMKSPSPCRGSRGPQPLTYSMLIVLNLKRLLTLQPVQRIPLAVRSAGDYQHAGHVHRKYTHALRSCSLALTEHAAAWSLRILCTPCACRYAGC